MRIAHLIVLLLVAPRAFADEDGGGKAPKPWKALLADLQACEAGQVQACVRAIGVLKKAFDDAKDESDKRSLFAKLIDAWKRICALNEFKACSLIGYLFKHGDEFLAKDLPAAARFFKKACDGGVFNACDNLADMMDQGEGVKRDVTLANDLREKACEKGHLLACANLGVILANGEKPDKRGALNLFKKACDGGEMSGCAQLGVLLIEGGKGIRANKRKGRSLLEKACEAGVSLGCSVLGSAAEKKKGGKGALRWNRAAVAAYARECEGGRMVSCVLLGGAYSSGRGVGKDAERALVFYRRACEGDNGWGCRGVFLSLLGWEMTAEEVREAARAFTKAGRLLAEGCERGITRYCDGHSDLQGFRSKLTKWCNDGDSKMCAQVEAIRAAEAGK